MCEKEAAMAHSNQHQKTTIFRPWSDEKPSPSKDYVSARPASSPMTTLALAPSTSRSLPLKPRPEPSFSKESSNSGSSNAGVTLQSHSSQHQIPMKSYIPSFPCYFTGPLVLSPTPYLPAPEFVAANPVAVRPEGLVQPSVPCLREQEAKVKKISRSRPKSIACPHPGCVSTFSKKGQLMAHCRIHTGERPFECEECNKKFTRKEELTRHKRIHTGVKPFSCDQCGKRFGRSDHLKTHEKIHKRDRARMAEAARNYAPVYHMPVTGFGYPQYHPSTSYATPFYHPY